jgi:hypothetical protein
LNSNFSKISECFKYLASIIHPLLSHLGRLRLQALQIGYGSVGSLKNFFDDKNLSEAVEES